MASVTSKLIQEVTAHAQSDSLEDARAICADSTGFPNNLRTRFRIILRRGDSYLCNEHQMTGLTLEDTFSFM